MRFLLAASLLLLAGCSDSDSGLTYACDNTEVVRMTAPDGRHDAVLFERSCGATTGFSSQVSIVGRGEKANGSGNVLVADDDHGKAPAAAWGGPDVDMGWTSGEQLVVRHHPSARLFETHAHVAGVAVTHVADLEYRTSTDD